MKKVLILNVVLFMLLAACDKKGGSDKPETFSHLETLKVESDKDKGASSDVMIYYDKSITTVLDEKLSENDPLYSEPTPDDHKLIRTKINSGSSEEYMILFSFGVSLDPHFRIYHNDKHIGSVSGWELYVPGNGFLYTRGHTNNMFNQRRKFRFSGNSITEVKQPAYYVGLNSTTTKAIKIFSNKSLNNVLAELPSGTEVEVLVNEGPYFLVKTPFGLAGWIKPEPMEDSGIEGFYYAGD
ncbi:MAG: hypothetical protein ACOC4R_00330 [Bacteroidota bacterium]